jgi:zinc protease
LAPARPSRTLVVDLPGAGQAAVLVAGRTIGRGDPLYYAVRAANGVLGGGYSARLNEEIRIKRGLSYGAGSRVDARTGVGLFTAAAQTKNASAAQTAALMRRLIADLASAPLTAQELAAREASLGGEIARSEQTSAGLAGVLTTAAVYGLPLRQVVEAPQAIEAVDVDQARQAAPLVVDPALATLIVVGDAKTFGPSLQPGAPGVEVVSAAALDLDDPALVRAARAPTPLSPAGAPRGPVARSQSQGALGAPGD